MELNRVKELEEVRAEHSKPLLYGGGVMTVMDVDVTYGLSGGHDSIVGGLVEFDASVQEVGFGSVEECQRVVRVMKDDSLVGFCS